MVSGCPMGCVNGVINLEDGSTFNGPIYRNETKIIDPITYEETTLLTETPCPYRPIHGVLPSIVPHYDGKPNTFNSFMRFYDARKKSQRVKQ